MKRSLNDMRKTSCRKEELEMKNEKLHAKNTELSLECDAGMISNKVTFNNPFFQFSIKIYILLVI